MVRGISMKKLLLAILAIILLASVSSALLQRPVYNPWTRTLDYVLSDNQTDSNFTFNDINVTGVITGNGSGITDIPASAISDVWVNTSGDTWTGNMNAGNNNLTNLSKLNTGQGLNELFDMDQNVLTSSNVQFNNLQVDGNLTVLGDEIIANVTTLSVNGSALPGLNDTFDLGSTVLLWNILYVDSVIGTNLSGSQLWTDNRDYPAGCPEGTYVTINGDSNTCTAAVRPGGDTMTGDLNFTNSAGIRNISVLIAAANLDLGAFTLTGTQFISDIAQGTAPFIVTSSTLVPNLNVSFVNRTAFWDDLDTPADINAADITDDNTYATVTGENFSGNINMGLNNITNVSAMVVVNPIHCHAYKPDAVTITNTSEYMLIHFNNTVECIDISTDNENFTIGTTGDYLINIDMMADKTGGGTTTLEAVLLKNGVVVNGTASQRTVSNNNEVGFFGIDVAIDLAKDDNLSVGLTATSNLAQLFAECLLCLENVTARITITKEN